MVEDSGSDDAAPRDRTRVVLVVCCLLAVGLAGLLVPSLTGGVVDSPAESLVPGDAIQASAAGNYGDLSAAGLSDLRPGSGAGGFGALNPGQSTSVGGSTGASAALDSQSTTVHFTVTSSRPAYWRTGAYGVYTGGGWERTGESEPLDGRLESDGIEGPRVEYRVELNRSATALPTVWRPNTVDGLSNLRVTDRRAIRVERAGPGATYTGVSHKPPQDPSVLRTSGRDYPAEVEQRYAALPDDVPTRVSLRTDEITQGADSPYETAAAIEEWLEANKEYSLEADQTSDNIADTFIFEMERGYCEYFATTMTVMLRSQDIPARYVVGYSTGQQVGDNTYTVRGMNAHAWVEVYFEGVGWVKFDPTPGNARLQQERQSIQEENPDADYSPTEEGSPGEEFSPSDENTTNDGSDGDTDDTDESTDGPTRETSSDYRVSLNRSAVPGAAVEVTVTRNGERRSGVTVFFNGDAIGRTGFRGTVVGTVPYAERLNVTVGGPRQPSLTPLRDGSVAPDGGRAASGGRATPGGTAAASGGTPARMDGRLYSLDTTGAAAVAPVQPNVTFPLDTNASVAVSGDPVPGGPVTVTATVEGSPVRNGTVLVAGEAVARTDANGRARVTLPDRGGNVTVAVERGSVRGATTLPLPTLSVQVRPTTPLALPLTSAVVDVTADGEPVASAPVYVDGQRVATTDINGTATITLPAAARVTVRATGVGTSAETTVSGLFVNLALVVAVAVALVGGVVAFAYRRGYTPRDLLAALRRLPGLVVQYGQYLLMTLATQWDELLAALLTRVRRTVGHLRALVTGTATLTELRAALLAWLAEKRETATEAPTTGEGVSEQRLTVRRAWQRFLGYVSLRNVQTRTPGEIARHAVFRDDLPERPVRVLRDAFREVEYGGRSADDRTDRVQQAVREIESTDGDDGGES